MKKILVIGAGGFIGSHLIKYLKENEDVHVTGLDVNRPIWLFGYADKFVNINLQLPHEANRIFKNEYDEVYQFAADDGGIEYTSDQLRNAEILNNNVSINLNILNQLVRKKLTPLIFFASSAEVYSYDNKRIMPDSEIGTAKLFIEKLYISYYQKYNISIRIGRLHNIYGINNIWYGGKETVIYYLCKKIIEAKANKLDFIEIIGDGEQTRSFLYINDCLKAILRITRSNIITPIDIGAMESISINTLASIIMDFAEYHPKILHKIGPVGAINRISNNTILNQHLKWKPDCNIIEGLYITYDWVKKQLISYRKNVGVYKRCAECFMLDRPKS